MNLSARGEPLGLGKTLEKILWDDLTRAMTFAGRSGIVNDFGALNPFFAHPRRISHGYLLRNLIVQFKLNEPFSPVHVLPPTALADVGCTR